MKELCDITRTEFCQASFYMDENVGGFVDIDETLAKSQYEYFKQSYDRVHRAQHQAWQSFIEIGCVLLYLREDKIYRAVAKGYSSQGYSSFYAFCNDAFGIKKTTAKNLINVAVNFGDDAGRLKMGYSMYSYSQLVELSQIDQALRERVPSRISSRNMVKLKELYREYVPRTGTTVDDDLREWQRRHDEKKEEEARKKNAIKFYPANKPNGAKASDSEGNATDPTENENGQTSDRFEEADDPDECGVISTPDVPNVTFDSVRSGLMAQLSLLVQIAPEWTCAAQVIERALQSESPFDITSKKEYRQALLKNTGAGDYLPHDLPPAEKLTFKNDAERKAFVSSENAAKWAVWIEIPELQITYRRINFLNGDYLVARFAHRYGYDSTTHRTDRVYEHCRFYLCTKEKPVFDVEGLAPTYILEYLKSHKAELAGTAAPAKKGKADEAEDAEKEETDTEMSGEDFLQLAAGIGAKRLRF